MDPERYRLLKKIFDAAIDKNAADRAAFLDSACGADASLRKEIESLLETLDRDSFLEKPAFEAAPDLFESRTDDALIGKRLGPYSVTGKIGRGGMGIVYLARDTRLDRPVAIKMLVPGCTGDGQQRERLKREARAAARLTHPGIATVYSLEEFDDSICIVSEYVHGTTLRQILSDDLLSFPQILDIAVQIAQALAAAHQQGIVHRDLKPENIMRTESGVIKILDFGLARIEPTIGALSNPQLTRSGMFLGTPAYASPEQLRGAEVDRRTDIFSFGVIIYELAAGRHPFGLTDSMSAIAHILDADVPDLSKANTAIPAEFSGIIRRCLEKRSSDRYPDSSTLLTEIERLLDRGAETTERPSNSAFWWWQFHQAVAGFGYYGMLYPLWWIRAELVNRLHRDIEGSLLFFPALIAVGIAANLRLHLWFTSRFYISELYEQRRKVARWIRCGDWLFVLMLLITAIRIHSTHAILATLLISVAVGSAVASMLIEPTTSKAALEKE
ncbi:MAG: serine/threonine protein kinase [Acidobacteria bacterium]|nr:serine/threonine protein kinase [Acidobacteriota bacterium]